MLIGSLNLRFQRRVCGALATALIFPLGISALLISSRSALASQTHSQRALPTRASLTRDERALMSRGGGFDAPATAETTGQVGVVTTDNAPIYAGREDYGALLFKVQKDQQILITGQTDQYYAVVMANHTQAFISKNDVQLLDLKLTSSGATNAAGATTQDSAVAPAQNMPGLIQNILQSAFLYKGVTPYVWGGNTIEGIDCSGFVKAVYSQNGILLPRTAAQQSRIGYNVPLDTLSQWVPGDRMYFQCHHSYIDHTGMYIGNGYFIHSSINHHGVDIDRVDTPYYWTHLVAVRRSSEVVAALQQSASQSGTVESPDFESNQQ